MKKKILLSILLILLNCKEKKNNDLINQSLEKFYRTEDLNSLIETYNQLFNDVNKKEVLKRYNKKQVIPFFIALNKKKELKEILEYQEKIDYHDKLLINLLAYNIEKENGNINKQPIYNNIKIIQKELSKSLKDSILYIDYFSMRSMLVDETELKTEIDSMRYTNFYFSNNFYEFIIEDAINELKNNEVTKNIFKR